MLGRLRATNPHCWAFVLRQIEEKNPSEPGRPRDKQDGALVIDEVLEAVAHWPRFAKEATVPAERVREVGAAHASLVNILKRC